MSPTTASWRPAVALHLAVAAVLFFVVGLAANVDLPMPYREGVKKPFYDGPAVLEGWVRFDAGWYYSIAADGYYYRGETEQSSVAFFPAYPLAIRGVHAITGGDRMVVAIAITFLSGLAVSLLLYRWCVPRIGPRAALASIAVLTIWPYAWYLFGAVYGDALFVALVLAAFLSLERDALVPAAFFGALATATRPVGMAVVLGLGVRQLERRGVITSPRLDSISPIRGFGRGRDAGAGRIPWLAFDRRAFRARDLVLVLSLGGFVAYATYLHFKFGDAFAFVRAQAAPGWENTNDPHAWFKVEFFERVFDFPHGGLRYTGGIVLQGILGVAVLASAPFVARRFGLGYGVYVAAVMAIPLAGSKDFQGVGRYALSAFPAFALAGSALATRRRLLVPALVATGALLVFLTSNYARGGYVA